MWFIFLVACIVVALATLAVIWIGSIVLRSIERQNKKFDMEMKALDQYQTKMNEEKDK